jgi:hypothetical protein
MFTVADSKRNLYRGDLWTGRAKVRHLSRREQYIKLNTIHVFEPGGNLFFFFSRIIEKNRRHARQKNTFDKHLPHAQCHILDEVFVR